MTSAGRADDEHGALRFAENPLGDGTEHESAEAFSAVRPDHNEISRAFTGVSRDLRRLVLLWSVALTGAPARASASRFLAKR